MLRLASTLRAAPLCRRAVAPLSFKATQPALGDGGVPAGSTGPYREGFSVIPDEAPEVIEYDKDGVTPLVVAPRIELTLEWLIESPPPEHTWEEPPIFYDVVEDEPNKD